LSSGDSPQTPLGELAALPQLYLRGLLVKGEQERLEEGKGREEGGQKGRERVCPLP